MLASLSTSERFAKRRVSAVDLREIYQETTMLRPHQDLERGKLSVTVGWGKLMRVRSGGRRITVEAFLKCQQFLIIRWSSLRGNIFPAGNSRSKTTMSLIHLLCTN